MLQQAHRRFSRFPLLPIAKVLGFSAFWIWNLLFASVIYCGVLPFIGIPLILATATGDIPLPFTLSLALFLAVPLGSMGLGVRFLKQPGRVMQLFYGVELPLLLLCILRLFALRELTLAGDFVVGTVLLAIATYAWTLIRGGGNQPKDASNAMAATQARWAIPIKVGLQTLVLLIGLYVSAILLIYALPLIAWLVNAIVATSWFAVVSELLVGGFDAIRYSGLWGVFGLFIMLGFGLLFWSGAAFVAIMPSVLAALYIHSSQRSAQRFARQYGQVKIISIGLATLTTWTILFGAFNQQPQAQAFALLDAAPSSPKAKQELLRRSDQIRDGLLNAYLADYRYVSSVDANDHIRAIYQSQFAALGDAIPQAAQNIYNDLAAPFLYQNTSPDDADKAAKAYREFFDEPIQKAEPQAITHALNSTANRDEAKAGLLNINQKKVLLKQQSVSVTEHGDWAEVELHETYQNKTRDVQEVYYSFSLPEDAIVTGVWLGDTDNRDQRFKPQVSPRGAAQKVYNAQVQRARPIDPALLEQVGPRHYRLRAFPVPVVPLNMPNWIDRQGITAGDRGPTEMHLWLTYSVMGDDQGWPMPQLGEKRNLFWSGQTERSQNGQKVADAADAWLLDHVLSKSQAQPATHAFDLEGYRVTAKPLSDRDYAQPQNQKVAIVLDSSRSLENHREEVAQTIDWLKQNGFAQTSPGGNDADLFIAAPAGQQASRLDDWQTFDAQQFPFFGSLELKQMLQQFDALKGNTAYDSIVVLTDGDTYELSSDGGELPDLEQPLWMVHVGQLPPAYDDGVLKLMQDSGGGVGTGLGEVLQRGATIAKLNAAAISDGYVWSVAKLADGAKPQAAEAEFSPLAARQLINQLAKTTAADVPEELDRIHQIAKQQQIVTPYSSMIVLVNDDQRRQLAEAEAESDRFDREVESGNETLESPNNPMSVPEPSPVMPLLLAGGLYWGWRQVRR